MDSSLAEYICGLEQACRECPTADLLACLGLAQSIACNFQRSADALEEALRIEPGHFFAQFEYSTLFCRMSDWQKAERETARALQLARAPWEAAMARRQLQDIRTFRRRQEKQCSSPAYR